MPEIIHLDQSAGWINLGSSGMRIQAPGLHGDILWRPPLEHAPLLAEAAALPDRVEDALREAGLSDQGSLTVSSGTASFAAPPARLLLDVPLPDEQIQFAIYRDESGVITLHQPLRSLPTASDRFFAHRGRYG